MLSPPTPAPPPETTRHRLITTNILLHTLCLIAALLLALMLLWHISTIALVEKYMMPRWWVEAFLAKHLNGWRVGVWVLVGVLVPVDCAVALLGVDWWWKVKHGRGTGSTNEGDGACRRGRESVECEDMHERQASNWNCDGEGEGYAADDAKRCEEIHAHYRFHPSIRSYLARNILRTLFDILILATLAAHIATYIISLPTALAFCAIPAVLSHPDIKFGETGKFLSVRDGCIGLNVDIHVAGGFAVFMASVLGLLHGAALAVRGWEHVRFGREGVVGLSKAEEGEVGREGGGAEMSEVTMVSTTSKVDGPCMSDKTSIVVPRDATSIGAEECSTGVRFVDWSGERAQTARRRTGRSEDTDASTGDANWSEVLLECLIDG